MNQNMYEDAYPPMKTEWVMGKFVGDQAKYIDGMASAGIGYYVLERPDHGSGWIKVAFRRAMDSPLPDNLQQVSSPSLLRKLNEWNKAKFSH